MSIMQNQLCRLAASLCLLPGRLHGRWLQRLQLPGTSEQEASRLQVHCRTHPLPSCCDALMRDQCSAPEHLWDWPGVPVPKRHLHGLSQWAHPGVSLESWWQIVTDAAGESTKIPRLQSTSEVRWELWCHCLSASWGQFDQQGIAHSWQGSWEVDPQSKSTLINHKYALRYLAGQERMCRMSGVAQRITPQLLNLRSKDQDMHRVLKVALQPWPTLVGVKALIGFTTKYTVSETYFRSDHFCLCDHDNVETRRNYRQHALDRARDSIDQQVVPVHECEPSMYQRPQPRTLAQLDPDLIAGSSGSLSRSSLSTLPSDDKAVTLRSRFSVTGSEAEYPDTIDGDHSDFNEWVIRCLIAISLERLFSSLQPHIAQDLISKSARQRRAASFECSKGSKEL